jgi:hypothetical protein
MDDGNRQLAITAALGLNPEQFEALDLKLGAIHGAVDKLAENISEPDSSLAAEISLLRNELGTKLTMLNESILTASDNLGKWLSAIAIAASTPDDNSAEVQAQIDKHASQISAARQKLQSSIDRNQP